MFQRKVYGDLLNWKAISAGRTAALIEGARRIGKSTVAEAFAQKEYDDYLLIDFSMEGEEMRQLFRDDIGDLDAFFRNLFLLAGKALPAKRSVIIFDEVQLFPLARQAIKPLVKDGRYDYIETGSLISIRKNTKDILIPSEEHRIRMYPMDFEEFLLAQGDSVTVPAIIEAFEAGRSLGPSAHRRIMRRFREYLAVGGMPQAVAAFVSGETYEQIDFIKQSILALYEEDLHKHDEEDGGMAAAIFKSAPAQLSHHNAHFKFSEIKKTARYETLMGSLEFLSESMMVNMCYDVTDPDPLMDLHVDRSNFKMFLGDTGLLVSQVISREREGLDSMYKALVLDKLSTNQGMIMENMIAQMLRCNGHGLRFHQFKYMPKPTHIEGAQKAPREKSYEVDFLLARGKHVCPVEVKSSGYRAHKSLDCFRRKYDLKGEEDIVLYTKDFMKGDHVTYLPVYMALCL